MNDTERLDAICELGFSVTSQIDRSSDTQVWVCHYALGHFTIATTMREAIDKALLEYQSGICIQ